MAQRFTIKVSDLIKLERTIKAIDKKVKTHNLEKLEVKVLDETRRFIDVVIDDLSDIKTAVAVVDVELSGNTPEVNGYKVVATIEKKPSGNIVKKIADVDVSIYRNSDLFCEHCKTRRAKKYSIILQRPDGSLMQVGRTCVADFLNDVKVEQYLLILDAAKDSLECLSFSADSEYNKYQVQREVGVDNKEFVSISIAVINKFGWVSKATSKETSKMATADRVASILYNNKYAEKVQVSEDDIEEAEKALEWIINQEPDTDYIHNLKVIAEDGYVEYKNFGYLASLPIAYRKATSIESNKITYNSNHVGVVGEKIDIEAVVINVSKTEGYYGPVCVISYRTSSGDLLVTFTGSGTSAPYAEKGDAVKIRGTVKAHQKFNNENQTVLTRVKTLGAAAV
jgi:hypothetical protein